MNKNLSLFLTSLVFVMSACSDMPTSSSFDEETTFATNPSQAFDFQALSKIGSGSSTTGSTLGVDASSLSIDKPTSSAGDFLIAQIDVNGLATTDVICAPAGWVSILRTNATNKVSQEIFWKTAGAEAGPYVWQLRTSSGVCGGLSKKAIGGIIAYTNVDVAHASGPVFASLGAVTSDATTFDAPSIDNVPAGSRVVRYFGSEKKEALIATSGSGSSLVYAVRNDKVNLDDEKPSIAAADAEQAALGATGVVTGTQGGSLHGAWAAQTIVLRAANTKPTLTGVPANATIDELVLYQFDADATDDDVPAQTLTFSLQGSPPSGTSINSSTGVFSWTPTESQDGGPYSIVVRVTDDGTPAMYDEKTIEITVNDVNSTPTLSNVPSSETICEGSEYSFDADASDTDVPVQTLTFSLQGTVPAGASINGSTGVFTWTPAESQDGGPYVFKVRVTDDGADGALYDEDEISLTVSEANVAPVLDPIGNQAVIAGNNLSFTATASDTDLVNASANTLTFSLEAPVPAGATIDGTSGLFSWTPTAGQVGPHSVTVRVTDDGPGGSCGTASLYDEETFTITVEAAPSGAKIVDIKPGTGLNSVNCTNANALIPVALLTTNDFDATTVDHTTVRFEGAAEWHVNKKTYVGTRHEEDVNGDNREDLVFHFALTETTLTCDSVEGTLTGLTYSGAVVVGVDGINMITPSSY